MYACMLTGDDLDGIETRWGFPHCAGAIDGMRIPIIAQTTATFPYESLFAGRSGLVVFKLPVA